MKFLSSSSTKNTRPGWPDAGRGRGGGAMTQKTVTLICVVLGFAVLPPFGAIIGLVVGLAFQLIAKVMERER